LFNFINHATPTKLLLWDFVKISISDFWIDSQIHLALGGDIKITFPLTTSGMAARLEVIKFFHIAEASE
jgi:hypothetical protein